MESHCGPIAEKHNHKFCMAVKRALATFGNVPIAGAPTRVEQAFNSRSKNSNAPGHILPGNFAVTQQREERPAWARNRAPSPWTCSTVERRSPARDSAASCAMIAASSAGIAAEVCTKVTMPWVDGCMPIMVSDSSLLDSIMMTSASGYNLHLQIMVQALTEMGIVQRLGTTSMKDMESPLECTD